jgi:hypothetical protein
MPRANKNRHEARGNRQQSGSKSPIVQVVQWFGRLTMTGSIIRSSFVEGCAPFKPLNTKVGSKRSIPGFQSFQTFEELKPKRGELPRFGNSRNIEMSLTQ